MKMHLAASCPNEGARRLAWWLGEQHAGDLAQVERLRGVSAITLQRLLDGELTPGREIATALFRDADEPVLARDWVRDAEGGWFDRPASRFSRTTRGVSPLLPARAGEADASRRIDAGAGR